MKRLARVAPALPEVLPEILPPAAPILPDLPRPAPEKQREMLRLVYFTCYRRLNFSPSYAARCAGYPAQKIQQEGFLLDLDRQIEQYGILALIDIPNRLLYATQRHLNFASLVELRDQREDLRISLAATKILVDLDNRDAFDAQEIADEEMSGWSKEDLIRYVRDGTVPLRQHRGALQVFAENTQDAEIDDDHPDRGMLG